MTNRSTTATAIGWLFLAALLAGILSIAPAIDSPNVLRAAPAQPGLVMAGAMAQLAMLLCYLGVGVLLYRVLAPHAPGLALGFLMLRLVAIGIGVIGTALISLLLLLGQQSGADIPDASQSLAHALRGARDALNHGYMIIFLCLGNALAYLVILRAGLLPRLFAHWGLASALLSSWASIAILFQLIEVIAPTYLLLNAPTALLEPALGVWLIWRGFSGPDKAG